jgi:hypothetical protein
MSGPTDWVKSVGNRVDEETREVYALAGLALYMAQVLEHGVVNAVVAIRQIEWLKSKHLLGQVVGVVGGTHPQVVESLTEQIERLWDDNFGLTLGQLIKSISSEVTVDDDLQIALDQSLKARNRLAHRFFREHDINCLNAHGRRFMARELDEMRELFVSTDRLLQPVTDQLWKILGVTPDLVARAAEQSISLAKMRASEAEIERAIHATPFPE